MSGTILWICVAAAVLAVWAVVALVVGTVVGRALKRASAVLENGETPVRSSGAGVSWVAGSMLRPASRR